MNLVKAIMISLGTISLCLGVLGIVVPGLPTTPFLLLTAGLYVRSSDKLYHKLTTNRIIGSYILEFRAARGMKRRNKIVSIVMMWIMIAVSCTFFIPSVSAKLFVLFMGIIGTVVMGFVIPTINISENNNQ